MLAKNRKLHWQLNSLLPLRKRRQKHWPKLGPQRAMGSSTWKKGRTNEKLEDNKQPHAPDQDFESNYFSKARLCVFSI